MRSRGAGGGRAARGLPLADLIGQAIVSHGLTLECAAKEIRRLAATERDTAYCSKQTVSTWRSGSATPQPRNALAAYLEALQFAERAAPFARSRIYAGAAAALAQQGDVELAAKYVGKAQDAFPARPELDPHWQSVDYGVWLLAFYEGLTHLSRNDPLAAERAFVSYEKHPMAALTPERCRLEILNQRARAAIMSGELEPCADRLRSAVAGAMTIRSRKRLDEALSIYRNETPRAWRNHPSLKSIAEVQQA